MLDERARRHLVEMGIDTYVLRGAAAAEIAVPPVDSAVRSALSNSHAITPNALRSMRVAVSIVVDAQAPDAAIIDDLRRALRMTGATVNVAQTVSAAQLHVVFGASPDATRTASDTTVMAGSVAALRGDPLGKRALWRDISGLLRRAMRASGADAQLTD